MLTAGHHRELHRNTGEGQYTHSHSIEEAVYRSSLAFIDISLQDFRALIASVITDGGYRKRAYRYVAAPALVRHLGHIVLDLHEVPGIIQVPSNIQYGSKGSGNEFIVTDPHTGVSVVAHSFKWAGLNTLK